MAGRLSRSGGEHQNDRSAHPLPHPSWRRPAVRPVRRCRAGPCGTGLAETERPRSCRGLRIGSRRLLRPSDHGTGLPAAARRHRPRPGHPAGRGAGAGCRGLGRAAHLVPDERRFAGQSDRLDGRPRPGTHARRPAQCALQRDRRAGAVGHGRRLRPAVRRPGAGHRPRCHRRGRGGGARTDTGRGRRVHRVPELLRRGGRRTRHRGCRPRHAAYR